MHLALPLFLFSFVVLQQIIHVESLGSPFQHSDNQIGRSNSARRLRAPLMGRSILSVSETNDDNNHHSNNEWYRQNHNDGENSVVLKKRRYGAPLFGRRWAPATRRGPLLG
ncbi:unnamed protein product [Adineta steineri]|uniref:Uncharacterized protein n=1 Tax=Adineta steineri TaxID=433720 RepID=A0A813ZLJ1_9BILA|nr:unnamed protein product [Adineta steineri]CAF3510142.1 unnamed protein product [Adineta steineri]